MKGMRYVFSDGLEEYIVEFTHSDTCIQPEGDWISAHHKAHAKAVAEKQRGHAVRVEDFESPVAVHRSYFRKV